MAQKELISNQMLSELIVESHTKPQVIFKHSTRCFISVRILKNTLNCFENDTADWYVLDLIAYRSISNDIEKMLKITHQSPQIIVINNGVVTYDASHEQIQSERILANLKAK